jgi:hypothetical protein
MKTKFNGSALYYKWRTSVRNAYYIWFIPWRPVFQTPRLARFCGHMLRAHPKTENKLWTEDSHLHTRRRENLKTHHITSSTEQARLPVTLGDPALLPENFRVFLSLCRWMYGYDIQIGHDYNFQNIKTFAVHVHLPMPFDAKQFYSRNSVVK